MFKPGIHTFAIYHKLTYWEAQNLAENLTEQGYCYLIKQNGSHANRIYYSNCFSEYGVHIYIYQSYKASGFSFRITPCTLLKGSYASAELYHPTRENYEDMTDVLNEMLKKTTLYPMITAEQMSISRVDPCINLPCHDEDEVLGYIRIIKKGACIRNYKRDRFTEESNRVKNLEEANKHSFRIKNKKASFTVYDKVFELQQSERCPNDLLDKGILRIEAGLKRDALLKRLKLSEDASNYEILEAAAEKAPEILSSYLRKMQLGTGDHIRYSDAVKRIEDSSLQSKMEERMLFLLRKVSDTNSMDAALERMSIQFALNEEQCEVVLEKFEELGISPITLRNDSKFEKLPSLLSRIFQGHESELSRDADGFIILSRINGNNGKK